uniref:MORC family CW-type zinc finger 3a n=1 Tax=Myripristis murdjan TaxID=586833 RepID=A0A667WSW6_9TELE
MFLLILWQLCPKFLHTNSTSHTWPFSAIAELIDNAYDPDVSAKQFWIDKTVIKGQDCLTFMDNGNGLTYEAMLKMLSFGYSDKIAVNGLEPIGIYGNGFKSGSMRLGQDAIVFSKSEKASCVGMLSQSYLKEIGAEQIIVPIVSFELTGEEHKASLKDILSYSPFKTKAELLTEIGAVNSTCSTGTTGTRIIIWNLRKTSTGLTEFDFVKDRYDIQIPSEVYEAINDKSQPERTASSIPESEYSLRAYCSILYLKPRMQIIIRGQKVKTQLISKSLAYIAKDYYRPTFVTKRIPITFGYNTKSKDQYGIMMYHKNRLIKAYERVGCQLKANISGLGVIGVIECNFLDPTHNKQNFDNTDKYRKTITSLGIKLEEYWKEIRFKRNKEDPNSIPVEDTMKRPDQNWVQCDECLRWRKLPDGIDCSLLPEKWFCHMNPDPQFRSCVVDEEPEDSDDDRPSYRKTYKHTTTQTEVPKVKEEDEEERGKQREDEIKTEVEERAVQSTAEVNGIEQGSDVDTSGCNIEQNVIKKESAGDDQAKKPLHNGVAVSCCLNNAEAVGPSSADPLQNNSSINEIQEQQDKLLELMETAAQERDDYKQQFHELTNQLHDMQMRLQELSQANIKKECAHQGSQTESAGEGQDYKNLYEQAKHKVDELSREKEVLLAAGQACAGTSQGEERISDELVLQIDSLIRELDKSNKERDALRSQVSVSSPSSSGSEMRRSLVGLRQNVGRLLTSFVPALDPDQVNYDCNVIDEILEQVLTDVESLQVNNLRERAGND